MSYGNLAIWCAQIAVLAGVAAVVAALFRLRPAPVRLAYWQMLLAVCVVLPAVEPWQRETVVITQPAPEIAAVPVATVVVAPAPAPWRIPWPEVLLWVLVAGVALRAGRFGLGLVRLRHYRRTARPLDPLPEPVDRARRELGVFPEMMLSGEVSGPVTFGFADPVILFPERFLAMDPQHQAAVACHELLHVRRRDWLFTAIEELVRAVFWFHPAVWWVLGQIQLAREQSVDREVVRLAVARERYVDALLAVSGARSQFDLAPAPLFLRRRHLTARVAAILKEAEMSYRRLLLSAAACAGCVVLAGWLVCGSLPLKAAPQMVSDAPGVKVTGTEHLIHRNAVEYPADARAKGIEGTVILDVVLAADGTVQDASVISGPDELRDAALNSIKSWHFMRNTAPRQQVVIEFKAGAAAPVFPDVTTPAPPPPPPPPLANGAKVVAVIPRSGPVGSGPTGGVIGGFIGRPGATDDIKEPQTLLRVMIQGLSPEATAELRRRLPVQEGQVIDNQTLQAANQVIHDFDPKLMASLASIKMGPTNGTAQSGVGLFVVALGGAPLSTLANVPRKIEALEFRGVSPEAEAELRQRVAVPVGQVLDAKAEKELGARIEAVVQEFDPHLGVGSGIRAAHRKAADGTTLPPDIAYVKFIVYPRGSGVMMGTAPPAAALPAPPPGVQRIRVGGTVQANHLKIQVRPIYPPLAKQAGVSGMVSMNALIGTDGKIKNLSVIEGHPLLVPAAMEAVRQWEYEPTVMNGQPVEVIAQIDVNFSLSQ